LTKVTLRGVLTASAVIGSVVVVTLTTGFMFLLPVMNEGFGGGTGDLVRTLAIVGGVDLLAALGLTLLTTRYRATALVLMVVSSLLVLWFLAAVIVDQSSFALFAAFALTTAAQVALLIGEASWSRHTVARWAAAGAVGLAFGSAIVPVTHGEVCRFRGSPSSTHCRATHETVWGARVSVREGEQMRLPLALLVAGVIGFGAGAQPRAEPGHPSAQVNPSDQ
jgi:hypothetical protein